MSEPSEPSRSAVDRDDGEETPSSSSVRRIIRLRKARRNPVKISDIGKATKAVPDPIMASTTQGLHRKLQEVALREFLRHQKSYNQYHYQLTSSSKWIETLEKEYSDLSTVIADSIPGVTQILNRATQVEQRCRALAAQSTQISNDFGSLMHNFSRIVIRNREDLEGNPLLTEDASELWKGPLCAGLFQDFEFDASVDYGTKFDDLMNGFQVDSIPYTIGAGWRVGFSTLVPNERDPDSLPFPNSTGSHLYLKFTRNIRLELLKILQMLACSQVSIMDESNTLLTEVSEASQRMRNESDQNRAELGEIVERLDQAKDELEGAECALPKVEEKLDAEILRLVILAKVQ